MLGKCQQGLDDWTESPRGPAGDCLAGSQRGVDHPRGWGFRYAGRVFATPVLGVLPPAARDQDVSGDAARSTDVGLHPGSGASRPSRGRLGYGRTKAKVPRDDDGRSGTAVRAFTQGGNDE